MQVRFLPGPVLLKNYGEEVMKIFYVQRAEGEYDDYETTPIKGFVSKKKAQKYAEQCKIWDSRFLKMQKSLFKHIKEWNQANPLPLMPQAIHPRAMNLTDSKAPKYRRAMRAYNKANDACRKITQEYRKKQQGMWENLYASLKTPEDPPFDYIREGLVPHLYSVHSLKRDYETREYEVVELKVDMRK